jgi:hypothetical protein
MSVRQSVVVLWTRRALFGDKSWVPWWMIVFQVGTSRVRPPNRRVPPRAAAENMDYSRLREGVTQSSVSSLTRLSRFTS